MRFYTETFDWKFNAWGGDYWLVTTGPDNEPGINGGLLKRRGPPPQEGQAVNAFPCTVQVPHIDEYLQRALRNGGHVALPKMPVPGVGWLAYVKDTEGNILGLMQNDAAAR